MENSTQEVKIEKPSTTFLMFSSASTMLLMLGTTFPFQ
jgi:hypothetical protein